MRTNKLGRRFWAFLSMFVLSVTMAVAATMATVVGQVVDQTGEPIIGASVLVKGTTNGTITDFDGNFEIQNVSNGATLVVSYVGFITQEVKVSGGKLQIVLKEDSKTLEELVVTGYATQAKKDITGSVAVVSRDAIAEVPVATFAEALQGKASGVYISTSGSPAADSKIRIRGVGSLNGAGPLVIVDGVQGIDISSVNPNDIESMQVLKDAAATAVYGARAANGVIIVTTKQGSKESKVRVSYNAYVSASTMANDGFQMMGAWDHMQALKKAAENKNSVRHMNVPVPTGEMPYMINPGLSIEQAAAKFGVTGDFSTSAGRQAILEAAKKAYLPNGSDSYYLSSYYYIKDVLGGTEEEARRGTNWYDMITQTGISQNHELSLQGGNDKGMYAVSMGYTSREGAVKGSTFDRYNVRVNATFNPTKHFTFGINSNSALMMFSGTRDSQADTSVFGQTYTTGSMVPERTVGGSFAGSWGGYARDSSPIGTIENGKNNWNRNFRMNTAFFAEIKDPWIKGLTLKSQFAVGLNGNWSINMNQANKEWNTEGSTANTFSENAGHGFNWQWTNTASYKTRIADHHDITAMLGVESLKNGLGRNLSGSRQNYIFPLDPNTWTLNNGAAATASNGSSMNSKTTMFGMFARLDYSYDGKYLVTATIRRDGASNFAAANRWGTFPSVSLGWRISDEPFLAKARESWLDDLKLRAGYGTTGNSNIGAYNYAFEFNTNSTLTYDMAGNNGTPYAGFAVTKMGDLNAKWETVKMLNFGIDLTALNNKLTFNGDFYVKKTSDMLIDASWSMLAGTASKPQMNLGNMENTGIDVTIGWRDKIGKLGYNISATASWYKNKVVKFGAPKYRGYDRLQDAAIIMEGQPLAVFYGYVLDGIYQNENEVMSYSNGVLPYGVTDRNSLETQKYDWIGHYKFKDLNGDGKINSDDKTIIGNPHPDLTGGFNIGLTYKNWDLGTYLYYSLGNDILKVYEYHTLWGTLGKAFSYDRVQRAWHPTENPNGDLPLWVGTDTNPETTQTHSGYVANGSYLRMQTLTLGYTLPSVLVKKLTMSKIRVYAQMGNVFTITGYKGLDPEINTADQTKGQDAGGYGIPRQYILGVNVSF